MRNWSYNQYLIIYTRRELPDRRTFELLPRASDLGLMICSVEGRVVVSKVKAYSIAGEDGKIERGDVIDELGKELRIFHNNNNSYIYLS